jgi:hypothetical protein
MFRQLGAILLLFSFSTKMFDKAVTVLDYQANTTTFAKNSENKEKPVMHCNGKCQMIKQLKKESRKEQQRQAPTGRIKMKSFPQNRFLQYCSLLISDCLTSFFHCTIHLSARNLFQYFSSSRIGLINL